jgi:hypothetical protein
MCCAARRAASSGTLAGKSDDAVLRSNVNGGGFQERLRVKLGFDARGDGVVAGLVASESEEQRKRVLRGAIFCEAKPP